MLHPMPESDELLAQREGLWKECDPHLELQLELLKVPIEIQIVSLAFVVGMRRTRPVRH